MNIKIPSISEFFSRRKAIENHKQEVSKIFGNSRSASRFKNNDNHIFLKNNGVFRLEKAKNSCFFIMLFISVLR